MHLSILCVCPSDAIFHSPVLDIFYTPQCVYWMAAPVLLLLHRLIPHGLLCQKGSPQNKRVLIRARVAQQGSTQKIRERNLEMIFL
jgi:hypothetical protein